MSSRRSRTLGDYLCAASLRKLLMITTALVLAAAGLALKWHPNLYEASTVITIEAKRGEATDNQAAWRQFNSN